MQQSVDSTQLTASCAGQHIPSMVLRLQAAVRHKVRVCIDNTIAWGHVVRVNLNHILTLLKPCNQMAVFTVPTDETGLHWTPNLVSE